MSEGALFSFGTIIFLVVLTGSLLYGMAVAKEIHDRDA